MDEIIKLLVSENGKEMLAIGGTSLLAWWSSRVHRKTSKLVREAKNSATQATKALEGITDYKELANSLSNELILLKDQLNIIQESNKLLKDDYTRVDELLDEAKEARTLLRQEADRLENRFREVEKKLMEKIDLAESLELKLQTALNNEALLRAEVARLLDEISDLKRQLSELTIEAGNLRLKLSQLGF